MMHPFQLAIFTLGLAACLNTGCETQTHSAHEHPSHGDHPHPAPEPLERPIESITRWGEMTQLFVEFPVLVRGEQSPFAAHLTTLNDHQAVQDAQVTVTLSGGWGNLSKKFSRMKYLNLSTYQIRSAGANVWNLQSNFILCMGGHSQFSQLTDGL